MLLRSRLVDEREDVLLELEQLRGQPAQIREMTPSPFRDIQGVLSSVTLMDTGQRTARGISDPSGRRRDAQCQTIIPQEGRSKAKPDRRGRRDRRRETSDDESVSGSSSASPPSRDDETEHHLPPRRPRCTQNANNSSWHVLKREAYPAAKQDADGRTNGLLDSIAALRKSYLSRGGMENEILRRIQQLEMDARELGRDLTPQRRMHNVGAVEAIESVRTVPPPKEPSETLVDDEELTKMKLQQKKYLLNVHHEQQRRRADAELARLKLDLTTTRLQEARIGDAFNMGPAYTLDDFLSVSGVMYDASRGFHVFWDFLSGIPLQVASKPIHVSWTVCEGPMLRSPVRELKKRTAASDPSTFLMYAGLGESHPVVGVPLLRTFRLVITLHIEEETALAFSSSSKGRLYPLGWTSIDIFTDTLELDRGAWRIPVFSFPIDLQLPTATLHRTRKPITGLGVFVRLMDAGLAVTHGQAGVNPLRDQLLYKNKSYEESRFGLQARYPVDEVRREERRLLGIPDPEVVARQQQLEAEAVAKAAAAVPRPPVIMAFAVVLDEIQGLPQVAYPRVRVRVVAVDDTLSPEEGMAIVSDVAEPGQVSGSHGWPDAYPRYPFFNNQCSPSRKLTIEVLSDTPDDPSSPDRVVAWSQLDIFTQPPERQDPIKPPLAIRRGAFRTLLLNADESTGPLIPIPDAFVLVRICELDEPALPRRFSTPRLLTPPVPAFAWLDVPKPAVSPSPIPFKPDLKFKIRIDAARYLPDNIIITQIVGGVLDEQHTPIKGVAEFRTQFMFDTIAHSPIYGQAFEIRSAETLTSGTVVVLKVMALARDGRVYLAGSCVIDLFTDGSGKGDSTASETVLNQRMWQLPLYVGMPDPMEPLTTAAQERRCRVPCATLLVMVDSVGKEGQASPTRIPRYSDGAYVSVYSRPNAVEQRLYAAVTSERRDVTVRRLLGESPVFSKLMGADLKATDLKLTPALLKLFSTFPTPLFDPTPIARYNPRYGFKLSVTGGENLRVEGFDAAIVGLCPPGKFWKSDGEGQEQMQSVNLDEVFGVEVAGGGRVHWYHRRPFMPSLSAIIDVRCMSLDNAAPPSLQSQGWTVLPIFTEDAYVRMGCFQLPLFDGTPPPKFIDALLSTTTTTTTPPPPPSPLSQIIAQSLKNKTIRYAENKTGFPSVYVTVVDARREEEVPFWSQLPPNQSHLPTDTRSKYARPPPPGAVTSKMTLKKRGSTAVPAAAIPVQQQVRMGVEQRRALMGEFVRITGLPRWE
ncbi:uncharacterized protein EV422DRAFT_336650 [Fimicolochytrium jonesii]|uniref:uncharacterized protein n=1 Tax=Fimicolochytrium jonesii TaxID=1396493 RepID=UPI0022FDCC94|nr:uncharacterized protein EV422DRAFT_336650 [Fimicolochytrium jonesii]KAI8815940.1 hypothetical protein EV422DRAFT_336650 [Fimicolochytrium jonesii]